MEETPCTAERADIRQSARRNNPPADFRHAPGERKCILTDTEKLMEAFDSGNAKAVWSQSQGRTKSDDTALTEMTAAALERLANTKKADLTRRASPPPRARRGNSGRCAKPDADRRKSGRLSEKRFRRTGKQNGRTKKERPGGTFFFLPSY